MEPQAVASELLRRKLTMPPAPPSKVRYSNLAFFRLKDATEAARPEEAEEHLSAAISALDRLPYRCRAHMGLGED